MRKSSGIALCEEMGGMRYNANCIGETEWDEDDERLDEV